MSFGRCQGVYLPSDVMTDWITDVQKSDYIGSKVLANILLASYNSFLLVVNRVPIYLC